MTKLPDGVQIDDRFFCTADDLLKFKEGRVWAEIKSWLDARREALADAMDNADESGFKLLQCERRVLKDLLNLPDLIISQLELKASNEVIEEKDDDTRDS